MTIRIEWGLSKDKRPDLNKDKTKARYYIPHIIRINFVDDATGNKMFSFVPKCEDEAVFVEAFKVLNEYDAKRMELFTFIKKYEIGDEKQ